MNLRFLIAVLFAAFHAFAGHLERVVLNPKTYTSASGRFVFSVDPSERFGSGPANCMLVENGRVVWEAKVPVTFHEAVVADDGAVAGYGYWPGVQLLNPGEVRIAIFGADGKQRLDHRIARRHSQLPGGGNEPTLDGIFLHGDRITLRTEPMWQSFRLSDGAPLGVVELQPPSVDDGVGIWVLDAKPLTGTSLTLVQWWMHDSTKDETGTVFTLFDSAGKCVWTLAAPADYALGDKDAEARLHGEIRKTGAILKTTDAGKFELWKVSSGQRILHEVSRVGDEWRVSEVSRSAHAPALADARPATIVAPEPEKLGVFTLDCPRSAEAVREVDAFGFDAQGRIGFLRGSKDFVLVEQSGTVVAEVPLQLPSGAKIAFAWTGGVYWIVTASPPETGAKARAWKIDAERKTVSTMKDFDCPSIEKLAGTAEGGFVALTTLRQQFSSTDAVIAFDAAEKRLWELDADSDSAPEKFLSPESLTVTTRGEVAVLDVIRHTVHFYDLASKHLRTVDLEKAWKRKPSYPSEIAADRDGGFIVGDFAGSPPFVRMAGDGTVKSQFSPKFADGKLAEQYGELRAAPDGRLWLNSRHAFLRLDDKGEVAEILGRKPDEDALGTISGAASDAQDRIYVADEQTGVVHVFDADGRKRHVCKPAKDDIVGNLSRSQLAVTDDGEVWLRSGESSIEFAPDGTRVGVQAAGEFAEWYSRRGAGGMLMQDFDGISLFDKALAPTHHIERWPDRTWIEFAVSTAVNRDGSFVVLGGPGNGDSVLGFHSATGEPQRAIRVPFNWYDLAGWNGTHLVVSEENRSIICDREGQPVRMLRVASDAHKWAQFLAREGRELWVLEFESRTVTRYAMPLEK